MAARRPLPLTDRDEQDPNINPTLPRLPSRMATANPATASIAQPSGSAQAARAEDATFEGAEEDIAGIDPGKLSLSHPCAHLTSTTHDHNNNPFSNVFPLNQPGIQTTPLTSAKSPPWPPGPSAPINPAAASTPYAPPLRPNSGNPTAPNPTSSRSTSSSSSRSSNCACISTSSSTNPTPRRACSFSQAQACTT